MLLQTYGLFWDSTGHSSNKQSYCYPCDSVTVLASNDTGMVVDSARKFEPQSTVLCHGIKYPSCIKRRSILSSIHVKLALVAYSSE